MKNSLIVPMTSVLELKVLRTPSSKKRKVGEKVKVRLRGILVNEGFQMIFYGKIKKVCDNYFIIELDVEEYSRFSWKPRTKWRREIENVKNANKNPCHKEKV